VGTAACSLANSQSSSLTYGFVLILAAPKNVYIYLFICALFKHAVSSSDKTAPDDKMTNE
jgi:hypothetical protein